MATCFTDASWEFKTQSILRQEVAAEVLFGDLTVIYASSLSDVTTHINAEFTSHRFAESLSSQTFLGMKQTQYKDGSLIEYKRAVLYVI